MTGHAASTIREISNEVAQLLIHKLRYKHVRFPRTFDEFKEGHQSHGVNVAVYMCICS